MSTVATTSGDGTAPDLLTLAEAAVVLRIGRTAVYEQARRFEASGGTEGDIMVVRVGRQFRVPRAWLEAKIGGPLTWPPCDPSANVSSPSVSRRRAGKQSSAPSASSRSASRKRRRASSESPSLFSV
jgi:hypothetical protein